MFKLLIISLSTISNVPDEIYIGDILRGVCIMNGE